ncbi:Efflux pump FUS6 [Mycena venus]|uniref:Efflux pump FUS6 n=1 Tax=Mycena venus TaxID=2733690 RepID=A0A8H6WYI5_9AGAR|nr:Efflux pump FUS6 [Mycena venus]
MIQTWGITISSTILQNMLKRTFRLNLLHSSPQDVEIAYMAIPPIRLLEQPLKKEVQVAFASAMATIWKTMIGLSGLGLLFSLLMAELPTVDETENTSGGAPGPDEWANMIPYGRFSVPDNEGQKVFFNVGDTAAVLPGNVQVGTNLPAHKYWLVKIAAIRGRLPSRKGSPIR